MRAAGHQISGTVFRDLATGESGAGAVRELCAAQASKHRLLVRLLVDESLRTGHDHAAPTARAYDALCDLEDRSPEEVGRCLRYPPVGAWALRTCRALAAGRGDPGRLAAITLAAAVRTRAACRLLVPLSGGTLVLPSIGRLLLPGGMTGLVEATVRPLPEGADLDLDGHVFRLSTQRDKPGWDVLQRCLWLTIDDLDPYRWPGGDAEDRLPAARRRRWTSHLRGAWRILTQRHEEVAAEVSAVVAVLVPVAARSRSQRSASARDSFGTIALSDPVDDLGMALTLAHEVQHIKLNALTDVIDLALPDDGRRYYAPWRPDPRPLFGLLHGAYAHAGVAGFWRRHLGDDPAGIHAQAEFARWRTAAYQAAGTLLDSGRLTAAGTEFTATLRDTLRSWLAEPVTPAAAARARLESRRHRQEWGRLNS